MRLFEISAQLMMQMRAGAPDEALVAEYHMALAKTREAAEWLAKEL